MTPSEFAHLRIDELVMTQSQLADALGVRRETISRIERSYLVPVLYELAIKQVVWQVRVLPLIV